MWVSFICRLVADPQSLAVHASETWPDKKLQEVKKLLRHAIIFIFI